MDCFFADIWHPDVWRKVMNETGIFLRPLSSLYFGAQGGSTAGEMAGHNTSPESLFPIPLSSLQGILRTRLLTGSGVKDTSKINDLVGPSDRLPSGWQIKGGFPARYCGNKLDVWLPLPFFIFYSGQKNNIYDFEIARLYYNKCHDSSDKKRGNNSEVNNTSASCNAYLSDKKFGDLQLAGIIGGGKNMEGWLPAQRMYEILCGKETKFQLKRGIDFDCPYPPFVRHEVKPGTAIDTSTLQTLESMLYSYTTLRFEHNSGFVAWFKGRLHAELTSDSLTSGLAICGRKSGTVGLESIDQDDDFWRKLAAGKQFQSFKLSKDRKFCYVWIVFLTPGRVELNNNYELSYVLIKPLLDQIQTSDISQYNNYIKLVSCLTKKMLPISGYSLKTKTRKPITYWWPAGTSLLIQFSQNVPEEAIRPILTLWNNKCLYAGEQERSFGYGHILVSAPFEKTWEDICRENKNLYW